MKHSAKTRQHDRIDQTLDDSFPASDPPAWNLGREPRPAPADTAPRRRRNSAEARRTAPAKRGRPAPKAAALGRPLRVRQRPRGLKLLSPRAWLRWALHPTVRDRS
jgi:hypothetical protein